MTLEELQSISTRADLVPLLRGAFPHLSPADNALGPIRGGRTAALEALAVVRPESYARTRNFLDGDVTRLSPYLRHGVLTLAEVRDHVLTAVSNPEHASKLVNELAWRDFWQRLYAQIGEGVWKDREAWKTGFAAADYAEELPGDVPAGASTLACMDGFAQELVSTGYLHNHARMWFAAWLVHWRRVRWQRGAAWFLEHLLDGDPASNNLSWQWVASTFASKPYIFNRENLERYTGGKYCRVCPHATCGTCPFEQSYEALEQTLFPLLHTAPESLPAPPPPYVSRQPLSKPAPAQAGTASARPLLWVHTDALNPASPMLAAHPASRAVFVWDREAIVASGMKLKRLAFLAECLADFREGKQGEAPGGLQLRVGDPATEVLAAARQSGADSVLVQRTPDPRLIAAAQTVSGQIPVVWYDPPPFVEETRAFDLKRFSRYWQRAQRSAMQRTRRPSGPPR